jgi:hypothetical protein
LGEGAPPKPGPRLSAARYSKRDTSGLAFTIKPGLNVISIEVESVSEEELLETSIEDGTGSRENDEQSASEKEEASGSGEANLEVDLPPQEAEEESSEESSP